MIKLGGSLAQSDALTHCTKIVNLQYMDEGAIIVPGGGCFADQVRHAQQLWQFDDRAAHRMAVLSMQQMAVMLAAIMPTWSLQTSAYDCKRQYASGRVLIWSPDPAELDAAGVASSWDVTSDSLAAWLANRLSAEHLLLVKSCPVAPKTTILQLQKAGVVDAAFNQFICDADYAVSIVHYLQL